MSTHNLKMNGIQLQRISKYRRADLDDEETSSNLSMPADAAMATSGTERCLPNVHYTSTRPHRRGFWDRASPLERLLVITVGVLVLLVLILSILLDQYSRRGPAPITRPISGKQCLSPECITLAGGILTSMDLSVDPCQDFYQYACGGWIKANPLPDGKAIWGNFGKLWQENERIMKNALESPEPNTTSSAERKARKYYHSCLDKNDTIDTLGAEPLLTLLEQVGGWTLLNEEVLANWSLQRSLELAHNELNRGGGLFSWGVGEDDRQSKVHIVQLDQGGLGLPSRDYYLNSSHVLQAYLAYMTKVGVLLGLNQTAVRQQMEDVVAFETRLAEITVPVEERRDDEKNYHKLSLQELQELAPFLNWQQYLAVAFRQVNLSRPALDMPLVVYAPTYFHNLTALLEEYLNTTQGKLVVSNYVGWSMVQTFVPLLSKPFREASKVLRKALLGTDGVGEAPWRYCVGDTNGVIGFALGAMFVREAFHASAKATAEQMIAEVRQAFVANFPMLRWMDPETQKLAKEKANAIADMIGFPDFIKNPEKLDKRYEKVEFEENDYFGNNVRFSKFSLLRNLGKLNKPVDRTEWEMTPTTVNAYYTATKNKIVFPAGILQAPFYDAKFPKSLNFGAMGVVMGHEFTHAFDDEGRKYDKDGNLHKWWKNSTILNFEERAQCFVEQYSAYTINKEHLNGKHTLGENIADNGGLKAAFHAYQDWVRQHGPEKPLPLANLTHYQLFFLGFAQVWCGGSTPEVSHLQILSDPHSPAAFRVQGAVANSVEFSRHYQCPPGTPMNPKNKCEVW